MWHRFRRQICVQSVLLNVSLYLYLCISKMNSHTMLSLYLKILNFHKLQIQKYTDQILFRGYKSLILPKKILQDLLQNLIVRWIVFCLRKYNSKLSADRTFDIQCAM
jgi:hypothetical protein